jgi:hypothetical protein
LRQQRGWVLLWVGVGLPRRPVDHKGARPGGECQLQAPSLVKSDHVFWGPGVDIPLLVRLASPRLGAEGDQLLQPEDCLTAASWSSKLPGRLRRPTNQKQPGSAAADSDTAAAIPPRSSVQPTYPCPADSCCDFGRLSRRAIALPVQRVGAALTFASGARRFRRHGRPILDYQHWGGLRSRCWNWRLAEVGSASMFAVVCKSQPLCWVDRKLI